MAPNRLLLSALCLATLVFPQALKSQTQLTLDSLELKTYSQTAVFTLMLQSKDLDWKVTGNGESKADLILITASLDKTGNVLVSNRDFLTVTANTEDVVKAGVPNTRLSATVKIPTKTNKVRFLVQAADEHEIGAFEVDRKTIYASAATELPRLPCPNRALCQP
jgi:hypothetical protein